MMLPYLIFTILAGLLMIVGIPVMLILALAERRRTKDARFLRKVLTVTAGIVAGMVLAWIVAVIDMKWALPFWETVYASGHSEIYGHMVEHAAETIVLFVVFGGAVAAIATPAILWLTVKCRVRRIDIA